MASPLAAICRACAANAVKLVDEAGESLESPGVPWGSLSDQELLARLPDVARAGAQVEKHLAVWVQAARDRGVSWARIGQALGMTRQSAWERFS